MRYSNNCLLNRWSFWRYLFIIYAIFLVLAFKSKCTCTCSSYFSVQMLSNVHHVHVHFCHLCKKIHHGWRLSTIKKNVNIVTPTFPYSLILRVSHIHVHYFIVNRNQMFHKTSFFVFNDSKHYINSGVETCRFIFCSVCTLCRPVQNSKKSIWESGFWMMYIESALLCTGRTLTTVWQKCHTVTVVMTVYTHICVWQFFLW